MITPATLAEIRRQLKPDEGFKPRPYFCPKGKYTIGYGHNLEANPISQRAAEIILDDDIAIAYTGLTALLGTDLVESLGLYRRAALLNMCFVLGQAGLAKFQKMIAAVQAGDWETAAAESLRSAWAHQVDDGPGGKFGRADRVAYMLATNDAPPA